MNIFLICVLTLISPISFTFLQRATRIFTAKLLVLIIFLLDITSLEPLLRGIITQDIKLDWCESYKVSDQWWKGNCLLLVGQIFITWSYTNFTHFCVWKDKQSYKKWCYILFWCIIITMGFFAQNFIQIWSDITLCLEEYDFHI